MLTDSGGFQVFSLSKLRKITPEGVEFRSHLDGSKHFFSPEHSMDVQIALGADVMMVFDECVETPASWERTRESMGLTHAWAQRSKDHFEAHRRQCFGVRRWAGRRRVCLGLCRGDVCGPAQGERGTAGGDGVSGVCDWRAGGGGAARGDSGDDCADAGDFAGGQPRYVMGVGYPDEIEEYAKMGVDMMDCVLPTRAGRHGLVFRRAEAGKMAQEVVRMKSSVRSMQRMMGRSTRLADAWCAGDIRGLICGNFCCRGGAGGYVEFGAQPAVYLDTMSRVRWELAGTPPPRYSCKVSEFMEMRILWL